MAEKYLTSPCLCAYVHLEEPEQYQSGNNFWSIQIDVDAAEAQQIVANCDTAIKASQDAQGGDWENAKLPYRSIGDKRFRIKFKTYLHDSLGRSTIPRFNAEAQHTQDYPHRGDTVCISYHCITFYSSAQVCGVTLYLDGVQIVEKSKSQKLETAAAFGFKAYKANPVVSNPGDF